MAFFKRNNENKVKQEQQKKAFFSKAKNNKKSESNGEDPSRQLAKGGGRGNESPRDKFLDKIRVPQESLKQTKARPQTQSRSRDQGQER